jgi:hypothetical protein
MKVILLFIFLCFIIYVQAQNKYDWSKYASLPFKQDSVQSFSNMYTEAGGIYPITQSKADIEIRLFLNRIHKTRGMYIIQCFKDSIVGEYVKYFLAGPDEYKMDSMLMAPDYKIVGKYKTLTTLTCTFKTSNKINLDSVVTELIKNKIFVLDDVKKLVDSFYEINPKLNNPDSMAQNNSLQYFYKTHSNNYYVLEIKFLNKYRNFRFGSSWFYSYAPFEDFKFEDNVSGLFSNNLGYW